MLFCFSRVKLCLLILANMLLFQAHVYTTESGECAAFLSNYDSKSSVRVMFNNMHYNLPPWSVSILPDCRNVVFNTAKVCNKSLAYLVSCIVFSYSIHTSDNNFFTFNVPIRHDLMTEKLLKPMNSCSFCLGWSANISDANVADKYSNVLMGKF